PGKKKGRPARRCTGRSGKMGSEVRVAGRAGEGEHVADVAHARQVHDEALKPDAEARVLDPAVAAQVEIPPVVLLLEAQLLHAGDKHVVPLLALGAADELADAGDE